MNSQKKKLVSLIAVVAVLVAALAWHWYRTDGPGKPQERQEHTEPHRRKPEPIRLDDALRGQAQATVEDWERTTRSWGSPTVLDYGTQSHWTMQQAMAAFRAPQDGRLPANYEHARSLSAGDARNELRNPAVHEDWMEMLWRDWGDYWAGQYWSYGINPTGIKTDRIRADGDHIAVDATVDIQAYVWSYPQETTPGQWEFNPTVSDYTVKDTIYLNRTGTKVLEPRLYVGGDSGHWWLSPMFNGMNRADGDFTYLEGGRTQSGFDIVYKGDQFNSQPYPMKPDPSFKDSITMPMPNATEGRQS
jgi:hypothetical protein